MADSPGEVGRELDGVVDAHQRLQVALDGLTDDDARRASLLPNWTIGHVLTHIARNADALRRMLDGVRRGEQAEQYPGGLAQRNDEIEAGAGRSATEVVEDVRATGAAFEATAAHLDNGDWVIGVGLAAWGPIPVTEIPFRRRREVIVHHYDLGLGGVSSWERSAR